MTNAIAQNPPAGAAPAREPGLRGVSSDMFLRLLAAQLKTQNPLEPQKGTEFVTQLSQFSALEQLIAIRGELDKLTRAAAGAGAPSTENKTTT